MFFYFKKIFISTLLYLTAINASAQSTQNVIAEVQDLMNACKVLDFYKEDSKKARRFLLNELRSIYNLPACNRNKLKKFTPEHYKLSLRSKVIELRIYSSETNLCKANLELAANLITQKIEQLERYSGPDCNDQGLRLEDKWEDYSIYTHLVNTGRLNVRTGPSTKYRKIDSIIARQGVKVDRFENVWAFIYYLPLDAKASKATVQDFRTGWVHSNYLLSIR